MLLHVDPHQIVSTFRTTELLLWAAVLNVVLERINWELLLWAAVWALFVAAFAEVLQMMIQAVVLQERLTARPLVWAPEFKLVEHRSIQLMDLPGLGGERLLAALVEASHVALVSTLVAYNVLTRRALDRVHNQELAHRAHQILVNFVFRKDGSELARLKGSTHRVEANVGEAESQYRLCLLNTVADFVLEVGGDQLQLGTEGALVVQLAGWVEQVLMFGSIFVGLLEGIVGILWWLLNYCKCLVVAFVVVAWVWLDALHQMLVALLWLLEDGAAYQNFIWESVAPRILGSLLAIVWADWDLWGTCCKLGSTQNSWNTRHVRFRGHSKLLLPLIFLPLCPRAALMRLLAEHCCLKWLTFSVGIVVCLIWIGLTGP